MDESGSVKAEDQSKQLKAQTSQESVLPQSDINTAQLNTAQREIIKDVRDQSFTGGASEAQMKWEHDIFRDVLNNVNQTLRFQISMAVPLMAACVTVLNIVPPQAHQELLNLLDRWVFLPVLFSIAIAYHGLQKHWYLDKKMTKLVDSIDELYQLVRFKYKMVSYALLLQGLGLILMMVFVLLEYK